MKPRTLPTPHPFEPDEADIQHRAYLLWREEGCPSGRDLEIWLTAKEMLRHQAARPDRRRNRVAAVPRA